MIQFARLGRAADARCGTAGLDKRRPPDEQADILDPHRKLAWAIANRDPEEAEKCMAQHFDEAIGTMLK